MDLTARIKLYVDKVGKNLKGNQATRLRKNKEGKEKNSAKAFYAKNYCSLLKTNT